MRRPSLLLLALLIPAGGALAAATDCAPPAGFEGWRDGGEAGGPLRPGVAARLVLKPVAGFPWSAPPTRVAVPGSFGAEASVEVRRPGLYRIALDQPAWIDLLRDGKPVASADHRHGAPCAGIAKIVGFRLAAGRYTLRLSASPAATARVLMVPAD